MSDRERIRQLEEQARALGLSQEQVESMKTAILSSQSTEPKKRSAQVEGGVPFGKYSLVERLGNGVLSKMYKAISPDGEVVLKNHASRLHEVSFHRSLFGIIIQNG